MPYVQNCHVYNVAVNTAKKAEVYYFKVNTAFERVERVASVTNM